MPTLAEETYEAVCGALHYNEFVFVRELPAVRGRGRQVFWTIGNEDMLQSIRVTVTLDGQFVLVKIEWRITAAPPRIVKAAKELRLDTKAEGGDRTKLEAATLQAVERCLQVYLDVLEQKGHASAQYLADHERRKMN